jgi:hypothetical protein
MCLKGYAMLAPYIANAIEINPQTGVRSEPVEAIDEQEDCKN